MCGIAGIITSNPSENQLRRMLGKQAHRGPDNTGIFLDEGWAAIGHNRLAIIDLSADAHEPFCDTTGRYYLSFNGEIYNYKELKEELKEFYEFRTSSDTEVLLASYIQWGKNCLDRFRGMFAFGIWDTEKKELFAARDRFGVKPFSIPFRMIPFTLVVKSKHCIVLRDPTSPMRRSGPITLCMGPMVCRGRLFMSIFTSSREDVPWNSRVEN